MGFRFIYIDTFDSQPIELLIEKRRTTSDDPLFLKKKKNLVGVKISLTKKKEEAAKNA